MQTIKAALGWLGAHALLALAAVVGLFRDHPGKSGLFTAVFVAVALWAGVKAVLGGVGLVAGGAVVSWGLWKLWVIANSGSSSDA